MAKILIVDDDPGIMLLVKTVLKKEGHIVSGANNGEKALEMLKVEKPDLILLDIMMPGIDGWETLELIRKQEHLKDTPVSMLSAKVITKETLAKADQGGLIDYIQKPFTCSSLKDKVGEILKDIDTLEKRLDTIRSSVGDCENIDIYKLAVRSERLHKSMLNTLNTVFIGGVNGEQSQRTDNIQIDITLQNPQIEIPTAQIPILEETT